MKAVRKLLAGIIGFPLLALGLILIPLPGPGLVVCLLALFILSFGFERAGVYLDKTKAAFWKIYSSAKARADKLSQEED